MRFMRDETNAWLREFLRTHHGVAGTVHRLVGDALQIEAAVNIPEPVIRATTTIPRGKGMAGLAWERDRPVQTCNLQDPGKDVRPGAKAVDAGAAVAFPVHDADGRVRAVVGIAFAKTGELGTDEVAALERAGAALP
jgi:L-methionine (R)-S-oxide reductase